MGIENMQRRFKRWVNSSSKRVLSCCSTSESEYAYDRSRLQREALFSPYNRYGNSATFSSKDSTVFEGQYVPLLSEQLTTNSMNTLPMPQFHRAYSNTRLRNSSHNPFMSPSPVPRSLRVSENAMKSNRSFRKSENTQRMIEELQTELDNSQIYERVYCTENQNNPQFLSKLNDENRTSLHSLDIIRKTRDNATMVRPYYPDVNPPKLPDNHGVAKNNDINEKNKTQNAQNTVNNSNSVVHNQDSATASISNTTQYQFSEASPLLRI